ncbi:MULTISPECIES: hypothetical protein [Cryobacterium]|uniref:hypothetical protein n=1 Tax=Cryobacterium TaxID=69578 RepID=UPI001F53E592|nr:MULTISPECIES: hypothetical protein [Cryobacterium]
MERGRSGRDATRQYADIVVPLMAPREFWAIGPFNTDVHQLSDDRTVALLQTACP